MLCHSCQMLLVACLNGSRRPVEHRALPVTPAEIAAEAAHAVEAGAHALHVHPKDDDGADTLEPRRVGAVLEAVREAVPAVPIGVTTGAWAMPDPLHRAAMIRSWVVVPDSASVNWHEDGAHGVAQALFELGVGVEAGLWHREAVASWCRWEDRRACLRVLLEVVDDLPSEEAVAEASSLVEALGDVVHTTSVLLHGEGTSTWPVFREAVRRGFDLRIGLEDVLVLPDGSQAADNAHLVAVGRALLESA